MSDGAFSTCRHCQARLRIAHRWIALDGTALCQSAPPQTINGKQFLGYHEPTHIDRSEDEK